MLKNLKDFKDKHAPKFGSGSSDESASARDRGQDLTTILDRSQRADLTILVAEITESMRNDVQFNFQTPVIDPPAPQSESEKGNEKDNDTSLTDQPSDVEKEQDPNSGDGEKQQNVRFVVKDKKAAANALSHFDDWRESVLLRVGEVLNRDEESSEGQNPPESQDPLDTPPLKQDESSINKLREVYHPMETPLLHLPEAKKLLILHSLLLLMLSLEHYNALSRVLMVYVVSSLGLDLKILNDDEVKIARVLLDAAVQNPSNGEEQEQGKKSDSSRKWKVGIASVAGAVLIGVTGGLAAPLVAAGLGTVMGGLGLGATAAAGYIGVLASSGVIVGGLFGAYGGRMTGRMMDKYAREVEDFAFIPIHGSQQRPVDDKEAAKQDHRLRVTIGITGWVTAEENFVVPWRVIGGDSEVFGLRWELESLMNLGNAISAMVTSAAWGIASKEILSKTIFAQIMSAVFLPLGLLKVAKIADNPFSVAKARSDKAGEVLADALINKVQGERPVNLIGYSLGSRVIYSCLLSLAKREAYGLVESVILMGSPIPSNPGHWRRMRSVVSGRLVNVFSENDSVLALLYRTSSLQLGVAGLQRVENLTSVENVDVSDLISGHLRYQFLVGRILKTIGLEDIDFQEVSREEAALAAQDRRQEEEKARNEKRAGVEGDEETARRNLETGEGFDEEGARLEKEVQEKTQKTVVPRRFEEMDLKGSQSARANRRDSFDSEGSRS